MSHLAQASLLVGHEKMCLRKQERYQKYLPDEHPTVIRTLWRLAAEHKKIGQYVAPASDPNRSRTLF